MPEPVDISPPSQSAAAWMQQGQTLEAQGRAAEAVRAYDEAIALLRRDPARGIEIRRQLGVAWMNRGNALQKLSWEGTPESARANLGAAASAYEESIALFRSLPLDVPLHRNHLGAACMNRGHALLAANDLPAAIAAFEEAVDHLGHLPLAENPAYQLNLAGARVNLAHCRLGHASLQARAEAKASLDLVDVFASERLEFAEMSLRARRALVMALGELLVTAESARQPTAELASEVSDAIDDGLALARTWEARGARHLRPLAGRLFRLGTHFYRMYQPHFLAEFVLENLAPGEAGEGFADDAEFRAIAADSLQEALAELQRPQLLVAGTAAAQRMIETARSLRDAQRQLGLQSPA
jgi:tetratricopeptide (TPR) repeat protein